MSETGNKTIKASFEEFHRNARDKGWWKPYENADGTLRALTPDEILSKVMLIVTELAEAVEEVRKSDSDPKAVYYLGYSGDMVVPTLKVPYDKWKERKFFQSTLEMHGQEEANKLQPKPEGFGVEIADAFIRIGDLVEAMGIDLAPIVALKHEYNKSRPTRHGNKKA